MYALVQLEMLPDEILSWETENLLDVFGEELLKSFLSEDSRHRCNKYRKTIGKIVMARINVKLMIVLELLAMTILSTFLTAFWIVWFNIINMSEFIPLMKKIVLWFPDIVGDCSNDFDENEPIINNDLNLLNVKK